MKRSVGFLGRVTQLVFVAALLCLAAPASVLSEPVAATDLIELTPDGVWTWYNDERAVLHDGTLFTGYVTSKGKVCVSSYNVNSGRTLHSAPLNTWSQIDDHNNPSLAVLPDGRIMALYARHFGTSFQTRITEQPGDVSSWGEEHKYDPKVQISFSHLLRFADEGPQESGGRLYNFTRAYFLDPCLTYTDDNGDSWSDLVHMVESTVARSSPYVKMSGNGRNRADIVLSKGHPRNKPENSIYHCYYRYDQKEQRGAFYRSDDSWITTFASLKQGGRFAPEDGTLIYDGSQPSGRAWTHDVARDRRGELAAIYSTRAGSNDLRYRYARWDGVAKAWAEGEVAHAGNYLYRPEFDYAGGAVLDPTDVNRIYLSANVDPKTGEVTGRGHYEIYQGITRDRGKTWTFSAVTENSPIDNIRPFVPEMHPKEITVLWCRGTYQAYDRYSTKVVGCSFSD